MISHILCIERIQKTSRAGLLYFDCSVVAFPQLSRPTETRPGLSSVLVGHYYYYHHDGRIVYYSHEYYFNDNATFKNDHDKL